MHLFSMCAAKPAMVTEGDGTHKDDSDLKTAGDMDTDAGVDGDTDADTVGDIDTDVSPQVRERAGWSASWRLLQLFRAGSRRRTAGVQ